MRRRPANAVEAACHAAPAPATRSAGGQHTSANSTAPRPSAIAANCTARTAENAVPVTGPLSSSSRSATVVAGAVASPTTNTKPPEIGCESAEITRYVTV